MCSVSRAPCPSNIDIHHSPLCAVRCRTPSSAGGSGWGLRSGDRALRHASAAPLQHRCHGPHRAVRFNAFRARDVLVRQGGRVDAFYILESDRVDVFRDGGDAPATHLAGATSSGRRPQCPRTLSEPGCDLEPENLVLDAAGGASRSRTSDRPRRSSRAARGRGGMTCTSPALSTQMYTHEGVFGGHGRTAAYFITEKFYNN